MVEIRKYKLLKELPDAKAGTIFTGDGEDSGYHYPDIFDREKSWTWKNVVENSPDWFELIGTIEVPQVKVLEIGYHHDNEHGSWYMFGVPTHQKIPPTFYPKVMEAIEETINRQYWKKHDQIESTK